MVLHCLLKSHKRTLGLNGLKFLQNLFEFMVFFFLTGVLPASMLQCFEIDDSGFDNHSLLVAIYLLILNVAQKTKMHLT